MSGLQGYEGDGGDEGDEGDNFTLSCLFFCNRHRSEKELF